MPLQFWWTMLRDAVDHQEVSTHSSPAEMRELWLRCLERFGQSTHARHAHMTAQLQRLTELVSSQATTIVVQSNHAFGYLEAQTKYVPVLTRSLLVAIVRKNSVVTVLHGNDVFF